MKIVGDQAEQFKDEKDMFKTTSPFSDAYLNKL